MMTTPHHHLHHASSASDLSAESRKKAGAAYSSRSQTNNNTTADNDNTNTQPRKRRGLMSKFNKLVLRNPSSNAQPQSSSAPATIQTFQITHQPDTMPLYSPPRPLMPRTESECQDALEEMYASTSSSSTAAPKRRPSTAPESGAPMPVHPLAQPDGSQPYPPIPPPKDNLLPPRSFPPRAAMLNTNIPPPPPPPPPKTAGARLESIPASPRSPSTIRSAPTPTTRGGFGAMTPGTPRTVDSNRMQRAMTGDATFHPPRPLSERALIHDNRNSSHMRNHNANHNAHSQPLQSPLSRAAPLTSSPVRMGFTPAHEMPSVQTQPQRRSRGEQVQHRLSGLHRHSPLSPLGQSPPMMLSPSSHLSYTSMNEAASAAPRRPSRPSIPDFPVADALRRPSRPAGPDESAAAVGRRPSRPDVLPDRDSDVQQRPWLPHQPLSCTHAGADSSSSTDEDDKEITPTAAAATTNTSRHSHSSSSHSHHTDRDLPALPQSPQLAPGQTKCALCPDPTNTLGEGLCASCAEHYSPRHMYFPDDNEDSDSSYEDMVPLRTPSLSPRQTPTTKKPKPLSIQTTPHHSAAFSASASASPGPVTPTTTAARGGQQQLEPGSSALYHLERSLQRENWEPLEEDGVGVVVGEGRDVVRVTTGEGAARRVWVRDSNDENADTMKMLVDEEEVVRPSQAQGERPDRRVEGGGGGYGDWFSYHVEQEEKEKEWRSSAHSNIYDRIQSIYDAYGGLEEEGEEDAGMF